MIQEMEFLTRQVSKTLLCVTFPPLHPEPKWKIEPKTIIDVIGSKRCRKRKCSNSELKTTLYASL